MINLINVNELYPHPNNPRKDVGDISELADSIKISGILQNLTVVKGHTLTHDEWVDLTREYDKNPTEEIRNKMNDRNCSDGYTVIIGHRRLAAAKQAGLTELPCVIADMDEKTQVATMLLENMQRSDLTVYEEAQGFQMMLDFGDSVEDISDKTGFSKTTVRRRVKLLDLDREAFTASISRGATLFDYEKLDKIKDIELKNKVLKSLGTANFEWEYKKAVDNEKRQAGKEKIIEQCETFAEFTAETTGLKNFQWFSTEKPKEFEMPEDACKRKYFYTVSDYYVSLYVKKTDEELQNETVEEEMQEKEDKRIEQLDELSERAYLLRKEFVKDLTGHKKKIADIIHLTIMTMIEYENNFRRFDYEVFDELAGTDLENADTVAYDVVKETVSVSPEKALLIAAYCNFNDGGTYAKYHDYHGKYKDNESIDKLYDMLERFGYELSYEEKAYKDGTHELFISEEQENEN